MPISLGAIQQYLPNAAQQIVQQLINQYGEAAVAGGAIAAIGLIIVFLYGGYRGVRIGVEKLRNTERSVGRSQGFGSLDDVDEDTFDLAVSILKAEGEEPTRKSIKEKAEQIRELETMDEDDLRLGIVQDDGERKRADQRVVAPIRIEEEADYFERNGQYVRVLTLSQLPDKVPIGWLTGLFTTNLDVRVSYHITPRDTSTILGKLQKKLTQVMVELIRKQEKNRTDTHEQEQEKAAINRLIDRIVEGSTKLYDFAIYIEVVGSTKEEQDTATRDIIQLFSEKNAELVPLENMQVASQNTVAPVGKDNIKNTGLLQEEALGTTFSFVEPAISDPDGILLGFDDTSRPIMLDKFSLSGYSKAVTGKIGSGKTYDTKKCIYRRLQIDPGIECIMFDPLGDDFVDFVEKMDGQVIRFGGDYVINPFAIAPSDDDVIEDPYNDKIRSLVGMLYTHFEEKGGLESAKEGLSIRVFHLAYLQNGITPDESTHHRENPTFQDFLDILQKLADGEEPTEFIELSDEIDDKKQIMRHIQRMEDNLRPEQRAHADDLLLGLEAFQKNGPNSNLNGHTNVSLDDQLVVFDMSNFADGSEAPLFMHVMLDWAYRRTQTTPGRMDVTFEEAHYLLKQEGTRSLLNLWFRHARHFDAGLTLISQTAEEFVDGDEVQEIYDQCDIKQMFYQKNVSHKVVDYYDLSPREKQYIEQAARGQKSGYSECLLSVTGHGRRRLEVRTGEFENHILDDDEDPWEYLVEHKDITYDDLEYLEEKGKLDDYAIPENVKAQVRA